ncbi:tyrosine-type recombinase/integrase [Burkholderia lata]|uniref:tyrosine-type recombinase/integrase n=1 Tax=Burkholderia lata (strain ATCC 17760 / DSM 23089 / LMG 22485 / NCIMB 9086 / R18194 / 383) TaxID=482957 RepID=UPI0020C5B774|nr:tyrosine-type recombinase/integrase [Burkholderia lata]
MKGALPREKDRIVPVSADLVSELRRYREANGLCPLPSRSDETPLLIPFRGANRCLHRSAVHDAIKGMFRGAAAWLRSRGPEFGDRADELDRASAHWLRHTAGSHMADGGEDLRTVRDNLGHASLTTTSLYLHAGDDVRHRETVARHTMKWTSNVLRSRPTIRQSRDIGSRTLEECRLRRSRPRSRPAECISAASFY